MTDRQSEMPELLTLADCGGNWEEYCTKVYDQFRLDFIASQPKYLGWWVRCRRDPIYEGKEAGFWHCVSEGRDEEARTPDLRRCERIRWVRAVLERSEIDPTIQRWSNVRGSEIRHLIWYREEYLVVVALKTRRHDGFSYWQLVTAYCTNREHTKAKLRKERNATHTP